MVGEFPLVVPGDVVELVPGMEDLCVMGTMAGFQKVTKIEGLEDMGSLTVSQYNSNTRNIRMNRKTNEETCGVRGRPMLLLVVLCKLH